MEISRTRSALLPAPVTASTGTPVVPYSPQSEGGRRGLTQDRLAGSSPLGSSRRLLASRGAQLQVGTLLKRPHAFSAWPPRLGRANVQLVHDQRPELDRLGTLEHRTGRRVSDRALCPRPLAARRPSAAQRSRRRCPRSRGPGITTFLVMHTLTALDTMTTTVGVVEPPNSHGRRRLATRVLTGEGRAR